MERAIRCTGNERYYGDVHGYTDGIHVCLAHYNGGKSGLRYRIHFHVIPKWAIEGPFCRMDVRGDPGRPTDGHS